MKGILKGLGSYTKQNRNNPFKVTRYKDIIYKIFAQLEGLIRLEKIKIIDIDSDQHRNNIKKSLVITLRKGNK